MQINNPTKNNLNTFQQVLRWAQSVYKAMQGGLGIAVGSTQAPSGIYDGFTQDNVNCNLVYVGANGSGAAITWAASNTGQAINHQLFKQPVGFLVVFKDKTCDVYSTATPNSNTWDLAITDDTANTIIMFF